jgi:hypothetical protein
MIEQIIAVPVSVTMVLPVMMAQDDLITTDKDIVFFLI